MKGKIPLESNGVTSINRRELLVGSMAAVALGTQSAEAYAPETSPRPLERPEQVDYSSLESFFETKSESIADLASALSAEYTDRIDRDIERIIAFTNQATPEEALLMFRSFLGHEDLPMVIADEIFHYLPFQACVESRFDPRTRSERGAFGIMQIMPETWAEHKRNFTGEVRFELSTQVQVAERLYKQAWILINQRCEQELEWYQENFMADNVEFEQAFMSPSLFSAYHAGMGTVANVLQRYIRELADNQSAQLKLHTRRFRSPYDHYQLMAEYIGNKSSVGNFGNRSVQYVPRILAAEMAFNTSFPRSQTQLSQN